MLNIQLFLAPNSITNGQTNATVIDVTLRFEPASGFVDRYETSISDDFEEIQAFTIYPTDIGRDGRFTVLFNDSRLIPGNTYDVIVNPFSGNLDSMTILNATLGTNLSGKKKFNFEIFLLNDRINRSCSTFH